MRTDFTITSPASMCWLNTFGVEAQADVLITYSDAEALPAIAELLGTEYEGKPVLHLGGGSNLLPVHDFHGVLLKSEIKGIERHGNTLRVGAAVVFDELVEWSLANGLYGLENLSLIPGEVGASAVQNIGAYGAEAGDRIVLVEGYNLEAREWFKMKGEDCRYAYRDSIFKQELRGKVAITHVTFELSTEFVPNLSYAALARVVEGRQVTALDIRREVIAMRQSKLPDPKVLGNAGSFFMNPIVERSQYDALQKEYPGMPSYPAGEKVKVPAAWLIEHSGWKGRSLGRAAVHDRQALVLVNLGGATGAEIVELMNHIIDDVRQKFGIELRPEVNIL